MLSFLFHHTRTVINFPLPSLSLARFICSSHYPYSHTIWCRHSIFVLHLWWHLSSFSLSFFLFSLSDTLNDKQKASNFSRKCLIPPPIIKTLIWNGLITYFGKWNLMKSYLKRRRYFLCASAYRTCDPLTYLLVIVNDVDRGFASPEVRLIYDVIMDEGGWVDHLCKHGHLPLSFCQFTARKIQTFILNYLCFEVAKYPTPILALK